MKYNKKKQGYTIESRFGIYENGKHNSYCRVKFAGSRKEQIVSQVDEQRGSFEDKSLLGIKTATGLTVNSAEILKLINDAPVETDIVDKKIDLSGAVTFTEFSEATPLPELPEEDIKLDIEKVDRIMAIEPDGDTEHVVVRVELAEFATKHKLDLEAVEACLEGKQKTHRKWRFATL